jgi:hypothetical protein
MLMCFAVVSGCAAAGTQPHEMSAAEHEARAEHPCGTDTPCWTTANRPTPMDSQRAVIDRQSAAEHRAAAKALRDAEAQACAGLSPDDRDISPFDRRQDIERVEPLRVRDPKGIPHDVGVTVAFRAVPGLTSEWLQRIVDCHTARNAVLGHQVPWMPDCPLVPNYITATVRSTGNGFAVDIRSDDPATRQELRKRADALTRRGG